MSTILENTPVNLQPLPLQSVKNTLLRSLGISHICIGLSQIQKSFLLQFCNPFSIEKDQETGKFIPVLNSLVKITNSLNLSYALVYSWYQKNERFKIAYDRIKELREKAFVEIGEEQLVSNVFNQKEVSTIFYLKNRLSDKYRDDTVLNQVYLHTKELNFNFVKTQVNNLNSVELISKAKELSSKLSKLKSNNVLNVTNSNKPDKPNTVIDNSLNSK